MSDEPTYSLGEFQLTHPLGKGGMAEVWAATHVSFGGDAALKVMLPGAAETNFVREAFVAEARSHAGLEHPNIVRLLDYGRVSPGDTPPRGAAIGDAYLVMERADATVRDDELPASWSALSRVLRDVLRGLAYSHARGFLHRDLKPENILRFGEAQPTYKLADFGIAQSLNLDETADRDTLSLAMGTPHYMAPEQFKGQWYEFGPATDLYALGCVAFELTSGRVPYPQTALMALATSHLGAPIPALKPRFDVPSGFGAWVERLLQKSPRDRFLFAADALHALDELAAGFTPEGTRAVGARSDAPLLHDAPTVVDALTDMMFGETIDLSHLEVEDSAFDTATSMPALAAPITVDWREPNRATGVTSGLGLFALRETPVVGFDDVRDELWRAMRDVVRTGCPRVIVLSGPSTSPVEALGTWLCQRSGEVGAAVTHDVFYTRTGGPREGLVALLEGAFGTWGMHDDEAERRIAQFVDEFVDPQLATSCREIATDLVLGARGVETRQVRAPSRGARRRVVAQVLESVARARPYLAWLAGVQWGVDAVGFARQVLERGRPSLVVLGIDEDELGAQARQQLEGLLDEEGAVQLAVREPSEQEQLDLVQTMLPLDADAGRKLVGVTRGDEVALRLLIDDLRRRDGLEASSDGYVLSADVHLPRGRAEIFERAVSRLVSKNPRLAEPAELSAILGRAPDTAELTACLAGSDVAARTLKEALEEEGLARSVGDRWWFVHDGVVDVLQQTARASGRWSSHHATCAEVLLKRAVLDVPDLLLRAAHHLVAAGMNERALGPLFRAARATVREDVPRARAILDEHRALCDELGLHEAHSARLEGGLIEMALLRVAGDIDASRRLAIDTIDVARRVGHRAAEVMALRHLARLEAAARNLEEAADLLQVAEQVANDDNARTEQAAAARLLGQVYDQLGDFEASIDALSRAADLYGQAGDAAAEGRALTSLASVLSHAGRLELATECAERALTLARAAGGDGAAEASNILGDIARMSGDLSAARERYEEARARFAFGASFNQRIVELNLAVVDLAEDEFVAAASTFEELRRVFVELELGYVVTIATAGMCACRVAEGDWAFASALLDEVVRGLGGAPDADVAEILKIARRVCSDAELSRRLDSVIDQQAQMLRH